MFEFFDTLIDLLGIVASFITNLVTSIVYVFQFIGNGLLYATTCIMQLPPFIYAPVLAIVAYSIIIAILNKGT